MATPSWSHGTSWSSGDHTVLQDNYVRCTERNLISAVPETGCRASTTGEGRRHYCHSCVLRVLLHRICPCPVVFPMCSLFCSPLKNTQLVLGWVTLGHQAHCRPCSKVMALSKRCPCLQTCIDNYFSFFSFWLSVLAMHP